jgi:hypothetical protein
MGSVLLGLGLIYSIVPAITGKNLNNNLGVIHLITTTIGGFGLAFLFTNLGFEGFVRREAIVPEQFAWSIPWLIFFAFTVGLGQIIFAYNLFRTLKHGQWFKSNGLYYAAAISTSLAGILHLILVQYFVGFDSMTSTFFIVSGLVQIFWLVPFLRKWGRIWYTIGIVGTFALIVLFVNSQASGETGLDWKFILFYLVVGGAQLFWIIPLILRWSKARFYVGIVSAILVSLFWIITNSPESIVGVEAPYDDLSIFIEGLQVIFIVTSVMVILRGGSLWPEKNIDSSRGSDHGSSNVGQPSTQ